MERYALGATQEFQRNEQGVIHASQLRHGLKGLWDRITGRRKITQRSHEIEANQLTITHKTQRQRQRNLHILERQMIQGKIDLADDNIAVGRDALSMINNHEQSHPAIDDQELNDHGLH